MVLEKYLTPTVEGISHRTSPHPLGFSILRDFLTPPPPPLQKLLKYKKNPSPSEKGFFQKNAPKLSFLRTFQRYQELSTSEENLCYWRAHALASFNFTGRICQEVVNTRNTLNTEIIVVFDIYPWLTSNFTLSFAEDFKSKLQELASQARQKCVFICILRSLA